MTQTNEVCFLPVNAADSETVKKLSDFAGKIVREHFDPIIGPDQNSYMIARFQSAEAIHEQIVSGGYRYYIVQADGCWAGFIAFYPRGEQMYLSKFYLNQAFRGRGIAGKMFGFIREQTVKEGLSAIFLNVNRFNSDVISVYHHFGFHCVRMEQNDIGNGFIMDDYVMEYPIAQGENGEWLWMTQISDGLDRERFLAIFRESSMENAPAWYPELSAEQALEKYESSFWEYICNDFPKEGGILAILGDQGGYRASLRLYPKGPGKYYVEAFETRPDSRRMGYGRRLYQKVFARLEGIEGNICLTADTGKKNQASIAAHLSAGFSLAEENPDEPEKVNFIYQTICR